MRSYVGERENNGLRLFSSCNNLSTEGARRWPPQRPGAIRRRLSPPPVSRVRVGRESMAAGLHDGGRAAAAGATRPCWRWPNGPGGETSGQEPLWLARGGPGGEGLPGNWHPYRDRQRRGANNPQEEQSGDTSCTMRADSANLVDTLEEDHGHLTAPLQQRGIRTTRR